MRWRWRASRAVARHGWRRRSCSGPRINGAQSPRGGIAVCRVLSADEREFSCDVRREGGSFVRARGDSIVRVRATFVMWALMTAAAAACSAGGAGALGDGGVGSLSADGGASARDGRASTPSEKPDGATVDPTPTYAVTCTGLCARAIAELGAGCDKTKCATQCNALASTASAKSCVSEWTAYLDCAVRTSQIVSCSTTGKLSLSHCSSAESALAACESSSSTPGQCVAKCTADVECQTSCPKSPTGATCCDVTTGICYASSTSSCPATSGDAGPPPAY